MNFLTLDIIMVDHRLMTFHCFSGKINESFPRQFHKILEDRLVPGCGARSKKLVRRPLRGTLLDVGRRLTVLRTVSPPLTLYILRQQQRTDTYTMISVYPTLYITSYGNISGNTIVIVRPSYAFFIRENLPHRY